MKEYTSFEARIMGVNNIVDPHDQNVDVEVTLSGENLYIATFFTIKNVISIMKHHTTTGESLSGQYFWASDMIIVDELSQSRIIAVVRDLLNDGVFFKAFRPKV